MCLLYFSGVKELATKVSEHYEERQMELEEENATMRKTLVVRVIL